MFSGLGAPMRFLSAVRRGAILVIHHPGSCGHYADPAGQGCADARHGLVRSRIPGYQAVALRPSRRDRPRDDEQGRSIPVSRIVPGRPPVLLGRRVCSSFWIALRTNCSAGRQAHGHPPYSRRAVAARTGRWRSAESRGGKAVVCQCGARPRVLVRSGSIAVIATSAVCIPIVLPAELRPGHPGDQPSCGSGWFPALTAGRSAWYQSKTQDG